MIVSTFELVYKPLTPSFGDPQTAALARRAVQGYFLTVSNLSARDYRYQLVFQISLPNPDDSNRRMENNTVILADVAGTNTTLSLVRNGNRYTTGLFTIPAGQTALVALLPNFVLNLSNLNPQIEIRGFVELLIPALRRPGIFIVFDPQSDPNVPVNHLLNAEVRGTFLPNAFPASLADLDFDQTNHSLPLAGGAALQGINPEPGGPVIITLPVTRSQSGFQIEELATQLDQLLPGSNSVERLSTGLALMTQSLPDELTIAELKQLLGMQDELAEVDVSDTNGHTL